MTRYLPMRLQCICYITVAKDFADFHKYITEGPSRMGLKWKHFPEIAASNCKTQVFLNTVSSISERTQIRQQKQAEKLGFDFALSLLKEAGYE